MMTAFSIAQLPFHRLFKSRSDLGDLNINQGCHSDYHISRTVSVPVPHTQFTIVLIWFDQGIELLWLKHTIVVWIFCCECFSSTTLCWTAEAFYTYEHPLQILVVLISSVQFMFLKKNVSTAVSNHAMLQGSKWRWIGWRQDDGLLKNTSSTCWEAPKGSQILWVARLVSAWVLQMVHCIFTLLFKELSNVGCAPAWDPRCFIVVNMFLACLSWLFVLRFFQCVFVCSFRFCASSFSF